jgi:hypothetical protein
LSSYFLSVLNFAFCAGLLAVSGSFLSIFVTCWLRCLRLDSCLFFRGGGFLYWSARPHSFSRMFGGVLVYRFLSVTLCFLETSSHRLVIYSPAWVCFRNWF